MARNPERGRHTKAVAKTEAPPVSPPGNLVESLLQITVNLIGDQNGQELPRRSGFLMAHRGGVRLITAAHGIEGKNWYMEVHAPIDPAFPDRERLAYKHSVGPFFYFKRTSAAPVGVDDFADVAFTEVDVAHIRQMLSGRAEFKGLNLHAYAGALGHPTAQGRFTFAAYSQAMIVAHVPILYRDLIGETDMVFDGVEADSGLHRFIVRGQHRGDDYKGASGAPIMNEAGLVVSIVKGGDQDERVIWGFPLTDFVAALDRGPDRIG
jgi:hypothetical protein